MEEDFLLYPEALALKELGFVNPVFAYFKKEKHKDNPCWVLFPSGDPDIQIRYQQGLQNSNPELGLISAPTYSQAFKWFRDKHQLYHEIQIDQTTEPKYCFEISKFIGNPNDLTEKEWGWENIPNDNSWGLYRKYEQAELTCLKKLIELINEKN